MQRSGQHERGAQTKAPRESARGGRGVQGGGRQGRPPQSGREAHTPRAAGAGMGGGAKRRGAAAPRHTAALVPLTAAGVMFVPGCRGGGYGWV